MKLKITARHFDLTPKIRSHSEEAVNGLTKFFNNIVASDLTLTKEKVNYNAELRITVYKEMIVAVGEATDLFAAIDMAADKAKKQLVKYKGKLKEKDPEAVTELSSALSRPKTDEENIDV